MAEMYLKRTLAGLVADDADAVDDSFRSFLPMGAGNRKSPLGWQNSLLVLKP
jgi:hypothetical protein